MNPTAECGLPATLTPQKRDELFGEIVRIYDLADNVMAVVAKGDNKQRGVQLELATPFITQTCNSANVLAGFYIEVAGQGRPITADLQDTIEDAFRNFFEALDDLIVGMEERFLPSGENI
jgi:hypothetical protein